MNAEALESRRRRMFEAAGLDVTPLRLEDREGRSLYALERRGEGMTVLLVHGGLSQLGIWLPLLPRLPREWRVVLVDRPGHGLSGPIDYRGRDYRRAAAELLEDVVDGLRLERVRLVGNSMGGYFSLAFALACPSRIEHLALVGAPAGVDRYLPAALRAMSFPPLRFAFTRKKQSVKSARRFFESVLVAHGEHASDEMIEVENELAAHAGNPGSVSSLLAQVARPYGFRDRWNLRDDVARLDVPTTFVWGAEDRFAPPASGADLVERMPRARLEVIEGAGHLPWLDEPDAVAQALSAAFAHVRAEDATHAPVS